MPWKVDPVPEQRIALVHAVRTAGLSVAEAMPTNLQATTHRIYTLYSTPTDPMKEPWATVLELSCGLANGLEVDTDIVAALTQGMYFSLWKNFARQVDFINPLCTLVYNPSVTIFRSTPVGTSPIFYNVQRYNLTSFMAALPNATNVQQCNDNANLLAALLGSLGINMQPLWVAHMMPPWLTTADRMQPATYVPAGGSVAVAPVRFTFHQFGYYDSTVYDPSTGVMGMGLVNYLNAVFPGQIAAGYISSYVRVEVF